MTGPIPFPAAPTGSPLVTFTLFRMPSGSILPQIASIPDHVIAAAGGDAAGIARQTAEYLRTALTYMESVAVALDRTPGRAEPLRVLGVTRTADDPRSLLIVLNDEPGDRDIRSIHEHLREWEEDRHG